MDQNLKTLMKLVVPTYAVVGAGIGFLIAATKRQEKRIARLDTDICVSLRAHDQALDVLFNNNPIH
jgi:hypothetical protein